MAEEKNWYGIEGIKFIYHGDWNDPEIEYKGFRFNVHDVEDDLYSEFNEFTHEAVIAEEERLKDSGYSDKEKARMIQSSYEKEFETFVRENAESVKNRIDDLIEQIPTFEDDREKMEDFFRISKDDFLDSYGYLSEREYDATLLKVNERHSLKEPVSADLLLGVLFEGTISDQERKEGSDTVVLSSGNIIEKSGDEKDGFYYDLRNKNDDAYLAFDGMNVSKIAEVGGISYFKNVSDNRMDNIGEVFSLNDDEIRLAFGSPEKFLSKEADSRSDITWHWIDYDDGSGHLQSPDGKSYFKYDWSTKEYKVSDKSGWDFFDDGAPGTDSSFSTFKSYAQNYILKNVDEHAIFEEKYLRVENFEQESLEDLITDWKTNVEEPKEAFISRETAKTIIFDDGITFEEDVVGFYAWSTDELLKDFIPSEKRLGITDDENEINFYFNYRDEANITMDISYYKGKEQIYEAYRIAPESEGYELLKFAMDAYCMEQDGCHIEDYKVLSNLEKLNAKDFSEIVNSKSSPIFPQNEAEKIISWFENSERPIYKDENGKLFVYFKNPDDILRDDSSSVLEYSPAEIIEKVIDDGLDEGKEYELLESVRNSLIEEENETRMKMIYAPMTVEKLMDFINIAEHDLFETEMAEECLKIYEGDNIPLVVDELGNVYQREMSKDLRTNTEKDLIELNPSGLIDYYKNQLEVESESRDEIWNKEHKPTIDRLNDIEDYLVEIENSFPLTIENAQILADYVNQNKEDFGKEFSKTNGHIPCFDDMTKELAENVIETLLADDYHIRYDDEAKKFFIYDQQSADNSLFEETTAGTIIQKANDIADHWSRDESTVHENEIVESLDKFLYPEDSFLPVKLRIDLRIPSSLKEKWENKGHSEEELLSEIEKAMMETMLTETVVKGSGVINAEEASVTLQTSIVVKEPYFNEKLQTKEEQQEIEDVLSKNFGTAIENRFVKEFGNDYKHSDRVMFENIVTENIKPTIERSWKEIKENFNEQDFDAAKNRAEDVLKEISVKISNIPEWAVGYMAYGDASGLNAEEITQVDAWMKENKLSNLSEISDERYFSSHPEFGLAGDCVDGTFIRMQEQEIEEKSASSRSPKDVIESYINKVKENISENDKKIVEKVLLASQKALSGFNADEKQVIGQFFLSNKVDSEEKLGKLLTKEVSKQEKHKKKENTRDSYNRGI